MQVRGKTADKVHANGGRGRVAKSTNARALCVGQAFRSGAFFLFPDYMAYRSVSGGRRPQVDSAGFFLPTRLTHRGYPFLSARAWSMQGQFTRKAARRIVKKPPRLLLSRRPASFF